LQQFLVLKLARSGSTMFGNVLDAHPSVVCVNEYLNRHEDAPRPVKAQALRSFYRDPPQGDPGRSESVVGQTMNPFKYGLGTSDIASAFGPSILGPTGRRLTARLRDLPIRLIVLLRENLLKQAVSLYIASRNELAWASSRQRVDDPSVLEGQMIDMPKLVKTVTDLRNASERLRQLAASLRAETMEVTFEQLQDDPSSTFESVFAYLGVPPAQAGFDYTAGFTKMLSEDLRDVVANYVELERNPVLSSYL
jgi:LPS sulfotransferase NodH